MWNETSEIKYSLSSLLEPEEFIECSFLGQEYYDSFFWYILFSHACAFFLIIAALNLGSVFGCILATLKSGSVL